MEDKKMEQIIKELEEEEQQAKEMQKQAEREIKKLASSIINAVFIDLKKIVDLCNSFEDFKKVIKEIKLIENKEDTTNNE